MRNQVSYIRPVADVLRGRISERRRCIQAVIGARQVGKTTIALQVANQSGLPYHYANADEPTLRSINWISLQWDHARQLAEDSTSRESLLILDEIQKVREWSDMIKYHWDKDTHDDVAVKVIVLGSAPLLIERSLTESLMGRFEVIHLPHWSLSEMVDAFGWNLEQYLYFGAYPGAASFIDDQNRWSNYIRNSLIEPTIARDVLLLTRVDKPALLRRLFELGCLYSGQILSYNKMLGQLQDAGNTTTLANYLDLLAKAGMLVGLPKFAGQAIRRRGSSPKLQVMNTALMTALSGLTMQQAMDDSEFKGRLVESSIGAHLANAAAKCDFELYYWRENNREVDFVVRSGSKLTAIEVKSGRTRNSRSGLGEFQKAFSPTRFLLVGTGGISVREFLMKPVEHWVG